MEFKNLNKELLESLTAIATKNTTQIIVPGENYIPVTGKVLDAQDLLYGVDSVLDGWLTTGRFGEAFEKEFTLNARQPSIPRNMLVTGMRHNWSRNIKTKKPHPLVTGH